jgi:hypothetical protein
MDITAAIIATGVFLKLGWKKPNLAIRCERSFWEKKQLTSGFTTVSTLLVIENKGRRSTTVEFAEMTLEYRGIQYLPIQSEPIDILVEVGASIPKWVYFKIPIATLSDDETFENAKLYVNHTFGRMKPIQISKIMHDTSDSSAAAQLY